MSCYLNASLILPSNAILYNNMTFKSCQCLTNQQNMSGFQYDNYTKSCYTFDNTLPLSNIRITIASQVCFINQTRTPSTKTTTTTTTTTNTPSFFSFINISTSISGDRYYQAETIYFTNTMTLAYLSIMIIVQKTYSVNNPRSYDTVGNSIISKTINDTDTHIFYTFNIINGRTLWPGLWSVAAQFSLNNEARNTTNDTYSIYTERYPVINGHF